MGSICSRSLPGDYTRDIEQIGGELGLYAGAAFDRRQRTLALLLRQLAGLDQLYPPEERVERRTQLVRERREELVFQPIRLVRLAVELFVLANQTPQPLLGLLQLGDVQKGPHRPTDLTLVVEQRRRVLVQGEPRAIVVHDVELHVLHLDAEAGGHLQRQIVGGDWNPVLLDREAETLGRRRRERSVVARPDTKHLGEGRVHRDVPALPIVGDADTNRREAEQRVELANPPLRVRPGPREAARQHRDTEADDRVEDQRVAVLPQPRHRESGASEEVFGAERAQHRRDQRREEPAGQRGHEDRWDEEQESDRRRRRERWQGQADAEAGGDCANGHGEGADLALHSGSISPADAPTQRRPLL